MKKIWWILLLPALIFADIGKVKFSIPLNIDQPFGMTIDNDLLLISDRASGNLYQFSIKEKKPIYLHRTGKNV